MAERLVIKSFALGPWRTNCYLLYPVPLEEPSTGARLRGPFGGPSVEAQQPKPQRECWIIDAASPIDRLAGAIRTERLKPTRLILTHAYVDHISGLAQIRHTWPDIEIVIHEAEADFLDEPALNLSGAIQNEVKAPRANRTVKHGDTLELGAFKFEVRHTPGNSPGGICIYQPDRRSVFVGDSLFAGAIGRADGPSADHEQLIKSINEQILSLPDTTTIYAGHGPATHVGAEKATNLFLREATA